VCQLRAARYSRWELDSCLVSKQALEALARFTDKMPLIAERAFDCRCSLEKHRSRPPSFHEESDLQPETSDLLESWRIAFETRSSIPHTRFSLNPGCRI